MDMCKVSGGEAVVLLCRQSQQTSHPVKNGFDVA